MSAKPIRMQVRCMRHDEWYYPSEGCPLRLSDHLPAQSPREPSPPEIPDSSGEAQPDDWTYFLRDLPPLGVKRPDACCYCHRPRAEHREDLRCPIPNCTLQGGPPATPGSARPIEWEIESLVDVERKLNTLALKHSSLESGRTLRLCAAQISNIAGSIKVWPEIVKLRAATPGGEG